MTEEQVAELQSWVDDKMTYDYPNSDLVQRVLEERKKLLAAAKLGEYYGAVADGAGKAEPNEIYVIAEAITYAEEPA